MKKIYTIVFLLFTAFTLTACTPETSNTPITVDPTLETARDDLLAFYGSTEDNPIPVTSDVTLPEIYSFLPVFWLSSDQNYMTDSGVVHRPSSGEDAVLIEMTFVMTYKTDTLSGIIYFSVVPENTVIIDPNDYYSGTENLYEEELKAFLHELIDDHTVVPYSGLWEALSYTDQDPDNPNNVILFYTGDSMSNLNHGGDQTQWNREHVWASSHGGFTDSDAEYSDLHHIRPTLVPVNGYRGNLDFDNGGTLVTYTDDCYRDGDSFEPRDEVKGDVARIILYMAVRYEGDSGELDLEVNDLVGNSGPYMGKLSVLIEWHLNDLPDAFEIERNERIFELQGNRNPFIDHPEFVEYIWNH